MRIASRGENELWRFYLIQRPATCSPQVSLSWTVLFRAYTYSPHPPAEQGKWILRFKSPETGKRRDMGLGRYPETGIAAARKLASSAREQIATGCDPIEENRRKKREQQIASRIPTFEAAALEVHANLKVGFRNTKHADQWINTLSTYVFPLIGSTLVDDLRAADFADALRPIWLSKAETASRIKQRCGAVMDWCAANGYIIASPVGVVDKILPRQPGKKNE